MNGRSLANPTGSSFPLKMEGQIPRLMDSPADYPIESFSSVDFPARIAQSEDYFVKDPLNFTLFPVKNVTN